MTTIGSESNPVRVAIIGSGPAGFYTVSNFLKHRDICVEMDMFDRLPTPYGLVRGGVAPDHQKYKSVTKAYHKTAQSPNYRFYGNVEYGTDVDLEQLKAYYHQIIFTTGAQTDRNMGVPGEELSGSHSATDFVAWYNGHPDYVDCEFDLSQENVAIVGVGNVAVDVARILCKSHDELKETDIADYALEALNAGNVKNVYMLGRRGPAQAAFTPPEIKEMGELADADVIVPSDEAELDEVSREEMEQLNDKDVRKNVDIIHDFASRSRTGKSKLLTIRFLVSPTEIVGDDEGSVKAIRLVKNEIYRTEDGTVRPRATDEVEEIPVGLVFRSVGYHGVPLKDMPFDERAGVILNNEGRVTNQSGEALSGLYVAGWIKRGPTGVIGTNKTDAQETVAKMVEDMKAGKYNEPAHPGIEDARKFIESRQPDVVSYDDWKAIDKVETEKGEASNRPRVKFTSVKDMLEVLGR